MKLSTFHEAFLIVLLLFVANYYCMRCPRTVRKQEFTTRTSNETIHANCSVYCGSVTITKTIPVRYNQSYVEERIVDQQLQECCKGYFEIEGDCIPVCKNGCVNGRCIAPDTCSCNVGFFVENGLCVPQCKNCDNGQCVAPEQCLCSKGYTRNDAGLCVPVCNESFGEHWKSNASHICMPSCEPGCENGICVKENQCSCINGYQKANSSYCKPICDSRYINDENGSCRAPNVLRCNENFKLTETEDGKLACKGKTTLERCTCWISDSNWWIAAAILGTITTIVIIVIVKKRMIRKESIYSFDFAYESSTARSSSEGYNENNLDKLEK